VAASRSLSLEDFGIQGQPADHQPHSPSPVHQTSPTTPLPTIHPMPFIKPTTHMSSTPMHAPNTSDRTSGISRLASYVSTQGSLIGSYSPILNFTPLPKQGAPDDSIESIDSPRETQEINVGRSFGDNPMPKFQVPEPEPYDDISCESQIPRPEKEPTPHVTHATSESERTSNEVPMSSFVNSDNEIRDDRASSIPHSDGARAPWRQSHTETNTTDNPGARNNLRSDPPLSAPKPAPQPPSPSSLVSKVYKDQLHTVIPQPHFLPSLPCSPPSLTEGMLATLVSPRFQNWLDKDGTSALDQAAAAASFSSDAWGRAAWIIPVRGRAPWEGCSGAVVSLRPIKERKKRLIVWTPAALRSFWTQMAGFRDSKRVGSLALSFEPALDKPPEIAAAKQTRELKASRNFEFIKLYHDVRVSLKLRTILQVLEFADEDEYEVDADVVREGGVASDSKRRLLGASTRLALLDNAGRIVLVS
jgi:hypothetical protein